MARTENYSWRVYGSGGPANPSCEMVAYITDPAHTPPQWQETLSGQRKDDAIAIVEQDKMEADQVPNGGGYYQSTINKEQRWYLRTSKKSGNSWEVVLDSDGQEVPNPCVAPPPPPPPPDRKVSAYFVNASMTYTETHGIGTLVLTGPVRLSA